MHPSTRAPTLIHINRRIATRSSRNAALTNASNNWSRCAGSSLDQPCIVAATRSMRRIRVPFEKRIGQKKLRKRKCKYAEVVRSRGPPLTHAHRRTPIAMGGFAGARLAPVRPPTASASSDLCLTVPATLECPRIDHRRAGITRELSVWISSVRGFPRWSSPKRWS